VGRSSQHETPLFARDPGVVQSDALSPPRQQTKTHFSTELDLANRPDTCLLPEKGGTLMSRKVDQIIARGARRWLVRVYLGREREKRKRSYHNRTIYGSLPQSTVVLP
jgi:hypothetical protein